MRITGGTLKGRVIRVSARGVRPTQERVREAIFSSLGPVLDGAAALDCFAGTGALGLEAWSRGAARVDWVEADPRAFAGLKANVAQLCGGALSASCLRREVFSFLKRDRVVCYDFVLADPPYGAHTVPFDTARFLALLRRRGWVRLGGYVVLEERSGTTKNKDYPGWIVTRNRRYGGTLVRFFTLAEIWNDYEESNLSRYV